MGEISSLDTEQFLLDSPNDLISFAKWQKTVNLLAELFNAPAGFLVQHTSQGFKVTIGSEQASNPYPKGSFIEPDVNIFCRKIVESGEELYVNNAPEDPRWNTNPEVHEDGFCSYLGVPVKWPDGTPFGTFCVMDYKVTHYNQIYFELIRQLRDIVESDLALMDQYQHFQKLAITDPLTELNNRRGFSLMAEQRIKLAKRMHTTLALFYIDVDNFKIINDNYSHTIGDEVLKQVAHAIKSSIRDSDVVGRMGGDEFVALMMIDATSSLTAIQHKLQQAINTKGHASLPDFTVTIGVAAVDAALCVERLLEHADKDMLTRKHQSHTPKRS